MSDKKDYTLMGTVSSVKEGAKGWNTISIRCKVKGAKEAGWEYSTTFVSVLTRQPVELYAKGDYVGVVGSVSFSCGSDGKDKVYISCFAKEIDNLGSFESRSGGKSAAPASDIPWE